MIFTNFKFPALLFILVFNFLNISCRKKIIEITPVIETEDISIPILKDVKYFSFVSDSIGYAGVDTNFIYKTTDGGQSWQLVSVDINTTYKCQGIEFFDEKNGMCLMSKKVYVTNNGGQTWISKMSGDFIGITKDGIGVVGENSGYDKTNLYKSTDKGKSFYSSFTLFYSGYNISSRIVENKIFVSSSNTYYYDKLYGIDINTGDDEIIKFGNLTYDENPNDVYFYNGNGVVVGPKGIILEDSYGSYSRKYYGSTYTFNSVDGYNGLVVAVGKKTIVSNLDIYSEERWNDVLDVNLNGFEHTFYRIRFKNSNTFYVSGDKGLIWKAKI